jgi:glyoxylase-like metal-dependent hydrolase (beta-lactamase superfamily II)/rhodanese-related sulfurtransferase
MVIEQIYTNCLSQGAYYIESNGEAAVIDPLREPNPYIHRSRKNNVKIKYIFETHIHADFVSGHIDLAQKTGAKIVFGPNANTHFDCHNAKDNEEFIIGNIKIKVLHTPGHTLESVTYLLIDEKGEDHAIFTGDTLFLGDVGRPDLAIKSDLTEKDLAGMMFESLRSKIMCLDDNVIVYPAHGSGSACGKNLSKETIGTIGDQKKNNYALRSDMTKEEFIKEVLNGISPPPQYFAKNALLNKIGYNNLESVLNAGNIALDPEMFEKILKESKAIILDVRTQSEFLKNHIPGSIFIGLNGNFAPWVGELISDINQKILLVVPKGRSKEAITRLARVGYDNTIGYLEGGLKSWNDAGKKSDTIQSITAVEFNQIHENSAETILDVRNESEFISQHIKNDYVKHFPLRSIYNNIKKLSPDKNYYIHCAGGYRSVIAASILKSIGIHNIIDVAGGFSAIKKTNINLSEVSCSI